MKVITEAFLRNELWHKDPECYYIPEGKILSPAAREYLQSRKIKFSKEPKPEPAIVAAEVPPTSSMILPQPEVEKPKYVDDMTGACYFEKPGYMTELHDNVLVPKDHPQMLLRGKLESLQAMVILAQTELFEKSGYQTLVDQLDDVLNVLHCMNQSIEKQAPLRCELALGYTYAELQERANDPMRFFGVDKDRKPVYAMGRGYAMLYQLYTAVREVEILAVQTFREGNKYKNTDITVTLNALSNAVYVLMCKFLAGEYK